MDLKGKKCVPCTHDVPDLSFEDKKNFALELGPEWNLTHNDTRIERNLKFKNFKQALEFVNEVSQLAEEENHHPEICFGWGYVDIEIWTHTRKNLTENDFILASKINQLVSKAP